MRFARPVANCVLGADVNARDRDRQRPASTQDTGMVSSEFAATRIVRLTMRFCFAPRSSSPSTMRTGRGPRLMNFRSGTLPCSETSVISTRPDASASSSTRYSSVEGSRLLSSSGIIVRLSTTTSGPRVTAAMAAATGFVGMPPLCRVTPDRGGHRKVLTVRQVPPRRTLATEDWGGAIIVRWTSAQPSDAHG